MSTELATTNNYHAGQAMIVADALQYESQQRALLGEYIARHMVDGTDYGIIPGTKKKTLLKPGAEKLTQLYRCTARYNVTDKIENWQSGLFHYQFQCQIVNHNGDVVAEGVGSCSTHESRYRWRQSERQCPYCGKAAIIKGKADFGGGWLCFKKKDGCGAKFADNDPVIVNQQTGRVENHDILDCVNTVLKMAKKRALVDAAIGLARCSDIFTQDIEDFVSQSNYDDAPHQPPPPRRVDVAPQHADSVPDFADDIRRAPDLPTLAAVWKAVCRALDEHRIDRAYYNACAQEKDWRKGQLQTKPAATTEPTPSPIQPEEIPF